MKVVGVAAILGALLIMAVTCAGADDDIAYCGTCGTPHPVGQERCGTCGAVLTQRTEGDLSPLLKGGETDSVYCGSCGAKIGRFDDVCPRCGSVQSGALERSSEVAPQHCGSCGARVSPGAEYCGVCGASLDQALSSDGGRESFSESSRQWLKLSVGGWLSGSTQSGRSVSAMLTSSVGYFFADAIEIGGEVIGSSSWGDGATMAVFSFRGTLNYYFIGESALVPYVGLHGGFQTNAVSFAGQGLVSVLGAMGGKCGLNIFLGESSNSVYVELDFEGTMGASASHATTTLRAGTAFYFETGGGR